MREICHSVKVGTMYLLVVYFSCNFIYNKEKVHKGTLLFINPSYCASKMHLNYIKHDTCVCQTLPFLYLCEIFQNLYLAHGLRIVKYFTVISPWAFIWVGYITQETR